MLPMKERFDKQLRRLHLRIMGAKGGAVPVFIFGEMRSGTEMLIKTLGSCPETECYQEYDGEAFDNYILRDEETIRRLIARSHAKAVIFKPITASQKVAELLATYPQSRGIWIYRWYPDVVNSALKKWRGHQNYLFYMLYEKQTASWRVENVSQENLKLIEYYYHKGISDASARALIWYVRNYHYFQQDLQKDNRIMLVNYEQIVGQPALEMRRILDFLGLKDSSCKVEQVFASSLKKHPNPDIAPEIAELCDAMYQHLEQTRNAPATARELLRYNQVDVVFKKET